MLCSCIDTDALEHNARELSVRSNKKLIAVLKHDAYSCGAAEAARVLKDRIFAFAAESVEEALKLRAAAPNKKVFVLAPIDKAAAFLDTDGIILPADGLDIIDALRDIYIKGAVEPQLDDQDKDNGYITNNRLARNGKRDISLRLDICNSGVGMPPSDYDNALERIAESRCLRLFSLFAHAPSLYRDGADAVRQSFYEMCRRAKKLNRRVICHLATSASWQSETLPFDAVRIGTNLFGLPSYSSQDISFLRPVISLFSTIERIVETDKAISFYDCDHGVSGPTRLGLITAGYGYLPALLGRKNLPLLVNGRRVKTIGSVYMGHMLVDLSNAPNARKGDTAVLVGESEGERITAKEFAESCGISVCRCEGALFTSKHTERIIISNDSKAYETEGGR